MEALDAIGYPSQEDIKSWPLTHDVTLSRAQATNEQSLENPIAGIKIQNVILSDRYTATVSGIPNGVDMYHYTEAEKKYAGRVPAVFIIFNERFYESLDIVYENLITKLGKLSNGTYYFQCQKVNAEKFLLLLNNHLEKCSTRYLMGRTMISPMSKSTLVIQTNLELRQAHPKS